MHTHAYVSLCACVHVRTCMYAFVLVCVPAYVCLYVFVHVASQTDPCSLEPDKEANRESVAPLADLEEECVWGSPGWPPIPPLFPGEKKVLLGENRNSDSKVAAEGSIWLGQEGKLGHGLVLP